MQYSLSEEMSVGMVFAKDTIKESFTSTLTEATEYTYSRSESYTTTVGCVTGGI